MQIIVAGYNLDSNIIEKLKAQNPSETLTPETISAAYARISRDPRPIPELRAEAITEVEKSRKSNQAIIFGLGHASVAEHAVFNFDILGVSRLLVEQIERTRLASYTEKSQRYITLQDDFIIPEEIKSAGFESEFASLIQQQNATYHKIYRKLMPETISLNRNITPDSKQLTLLEGQAKEDARYVVALATQSQLGMTINARSLEQMIVKLSASPLAEAREFAGILFKTIDGIAPSIIKYVEPRPYHTNTRKNLSKRFTLLPGSVNPIHEVKLADYNPDGEERVLAALVHTHTNLRWEECLHYVQTISDKEKKSIVAECFAKLESYDTVLREFEYAELTFELTVSAAAFAQLKRHRMTSQTVQEYNPDLGYTIPQAIRNAGELATFQEIMTASNDLYHKIHKVCPQSAPYALTNAHRRRMLIKMNLRELYHFSRLREDEHSQWDIRNIAHQMVAQAKEKYPLALQKCCGKDKIK